MSNANDAPERAPRTVKNKIIRVEDETGHGAYYYAASTSSAKALHVEGITARVVDGLEIMEISKRGLAVIGLPSEPEDDGPQNRLNMEPPTSEDGYVPQHHQV